jgi:Ribbon-helix-helix domain
MPDDTTIRWTTIRWTVSVSRETDITVRSFLAQRGMKKGDLSKFIEEAVKWRVLDQTMAEARSQFADLPPEQAEALIDEAVAATRKANPRKAG